MITRMALLREVISVLLVLDIFSITHGQFQLGIQSNSKDLENSLHTLSWLQSAGSPPVFRYEPPSTGYLKPHEVAKGMKQQPGRLVLENIPPPLSMLKANNTNSSSIKKAKEAFKKELTPSITKMLRPILSKRFAISDAGNAKDVKDFTVLKGAVLDDLPSFDISISDQKALSENQNPVSNGILSPSLLQKAASSHQAPALVTTPFKEPLNIPVLKEDKISHGSFKSVSLKDHTHLVSSKDDFLKPEHTFSSSTSYTVISEVPTEPEYSKSYSENIQKDTIGHRSSEPFEPPIYIPSSSSDINNQRSNIRVPSYSDSIQDSRDGPLTSPVYASTINPDIKVNQNSNPVKQDQLKVFSPHTETEKGKEHPIIISKTSSNEHSSVHLPDKLNVNGHNDHPTVTQIRPAQSTPPANKETSNVNIPFVKSPPNLASPPAIGPIHPISRPAILPSAGSTHVKPSIPTVGPKALANYQHYLNAPPLITPFNPYTTVFLPQRGALSGYGGFNFSPQISQFGLSVGGSYFR